MSNHSKDVVQYLRLRKLDIGGHITEVDAKALAAVTGRLEEVKAILVLDQIAQQLASGVTRF